MRPTPTVDDNIEDTFNPSTTNPYNESSSSSEGVLTKQNMCLYQLLVELCMVELKV